MTPIKPTYETSRQIERQIAWLLLAVNTLPRIDLNELERSLAELGTQVETLRSDVAATIERQRTEKSFRKQKGKTV